MTKKAHFHAPGADEISMQMQLEPVISPVLFYSVRRMEKFIF